MTIELGWTATDRITGFTGVIVGIVRYISGCNQALLAPRVDEKGQHRDPLWFDQQRLELDEITPRITLDNGETPGFDRAPPVR